MTSENKSLEDIIREGEQTKKRKAPVQLLNISSDRISVSGQKKLLPTSKKKSSSNARNSRESESDDRLRDSENRYSRRDDYVHRHELKAEEEEEEEFFQEKRRSRLTPELRQSQQQQEREEDERRQKHQQRSDSKEKQSFQYSEERRIAKFGAQSSPKHFLRIVKKDGQVLQLNQTQRTEKDVSMPKKDNGNSVQLSVIGRVGDLKRTQQQARVAQEVNETKLGSSGRQNQQNFVAEQDILRDSKISHENARSSLQIIRTGEGFIFKAHESRIVSQSDQYASRHALQSTSTKRSIQMQRDVRKSRERSNSEHRSRHERRDHNNNDSRSFQDGTSRRRDNGSRSPHAKRRRSSTSESRLEQQQQIKSKHHLRRSPPEQAHISTRSRADRQTVLQHSQQHELNTTSINATAPEMAWPNHIKKSPQGGRTYVQQDSYLKEGRSAPYGKQSSIEQDRAASDQLEKHLIKYSSSVGQQQEQGSMQKNIQQLAQPINKVSSDSIAASNKHYKVQQQGMEGILLPVEADKIHDNKILKQETFYNDQIIKQQPYSQMEIENRALEAAAANQAAAASKNKNNSRWGVPSSIKAPGDDIKQSVFATLPEQSGGNNQRLLAQQNSSVPTNTNNSSVYERQAQNDGHKLDQGAEKIAQRGHDKTSKHSQKTLSPSNNRRESGRESRHHNDHHSSKETRATVEGDAAVGDSNNHRKTHVSKHSSKEDDDDIQRQATAQSLQTDSLLYGKNHYSRDKGREEGDKASIRVSDISATEKVRKRATSREREAKIRIDSNGQTVLSKEHRDRHAEKRDDSRERLRERSNSRSRKMPQQSIEAASENKKIRQMSRKSTSRDRKKHASSKERRSRSREHERREHERREHERREHERREHERREHERREHERREHERREYRHTASPGRGSASAAVWTRTSKDDQERIKSGIISGSRGELERRRGGDVELEQQSRKEKRREKNSPLSHWETPLHDSQLYVQYLRQQALSHPVPDNQDELLLRQQQQHKKKSKKHRSRESSLSADSKRRGGRHHGGSVSPVAVPVSSSVQHQQVKTRVREEQRHSEEEEKVRQRTHSRSVSRRRRRTTGAAHSASSERKGTTAERKNSQTHRTEANWEPVQIGKAIVQVLRDPQDELDDEFEVQVELEEDGSIPEIDSCFGTPESLYLAKRVSDFQSQQWQDARQRIDELQYLAPEQKGADKVSTVVRSAKHGGLQGVFSRRFFEYWELLQSFSLLESFRNQPISIASISQGEHAALAAVTEFRAQSSPSNAFYREDRLTGLDLHVPGVAVGLNNSKRAVNEAAQEYFDQLERKQRNIKFPMSDKNMFELQNLQSLIERDEPAHKFHFIAADAALEITRQNASIHELECAKVLFCQILYALHTQTLDGTFVLQIFEAYYGITVQMLFLLCMFYKSVQIVRVSASPAASSQRFVVCQNFIGVDYEKYPLLRDIMQQWMQHEPLLHDYRKNAEKVNTLLNLSTKNCNSKWFENFGSNLREHNEVCAQRQLSDLQEVQNYLQLINRREEGTEDDTASRRRKHILASLTWCKTFNVPYKVPRHF